MRTNLQLDLLRDPTVTPLAAEKTNPRRLKLFLLVFFYISAVFLYLCASVYIGCVVYECQRNLFRVRQELQSTHYRGRGVAL